MQTMIRALKLIKLLRKRLDETRRERDDLAQQLQLMRAAQAQPSPYVGPVPQPYNPWDLPGQDPCTGRWVATQSTTGNKILFEPNTHTVSSSSNKIGM